MILGASNFLVFNNENSWKGPLANSWALTTPSLALVKKKVLKLLQAKQLLEVNFQTAQNVIILKALATIITPSFI